MSKELWATYSVKDHLQARALAVDVMLFDRLVFPVPETGYFPADGGPPDKNGPVAWKKNPAEWTRWKKNKWDPDGQQRLLDLLNPVIRKVPWQGKGLIQKQYRAEARKLAAQGVPDYAFAATRTLLTRDLPAYVDGLAALGPAYRSVEEIERDFAIAQGGTRQALPGDALATVLAWEIFGPDPSDKRLTTEELLRETVAFVVGDGEFRKKRTAFIEWQQKFLRDGVTDTESIKHAVKDMRELQEAAKTAANKLTVRKVARYAFRLAPAALSVTAALAGLPGIDVALGGAFLSVGGIAVDEKVFKSAEVGQPLAAAFVHDAQRHFGWK